MKPVPLSAMCFGTLACGSYNNSPHYIDAAETSLINAVLAGVSLDGERFFYTNTLRQLDSMPIDLRWPRERQAWISCYCCPPNVARTIATMHRWSYAYDDRSLWVLLYGSNSLKVQLPGGKPLVVEQRSDYPWNGRVQLTLQKVPSHPFAIRLRIPAWCTPRRPSLGMGSPRRCNGSESGFIELKGSWKEGDRIDLNLDMPVQLMQAHPLVEECRGQVAVQRGPLVYCLESKDLQPAARMLDVALSPDCKPGDWPLARAPDNQFTDQTFSGMVTIRAKLVHRPSSEPPANTTLYSPYQPTALQTFEANLIPYYAWGNRGRSEMTVWIPTLAP